MRDRHDPDVVAVAASAPEEVDYKLVPISATVRNDGPEVVTGSPAVWPRSAALATSIRLHVRPEPVGRVPLAVGASRDIEMVMD